MPSHVFVVGRFRKKWKAINIELKGRLLSRKLCLRLKMSVKFAIRQSLPMELEGNANIASLKFAPGVEYKSQFLGQNRWIRNSLSVFYGEKCVKDTIVMLGVIFNFSLFRNNLLDRLKVLFMSFRKYIRYFACIEINLILFLTFFLPSVGRLADLFHRCLHRLR